MVKILLLLLVMFGSCHAQFLSDEPVISQLPLPQGVAKVADKKITVDISSKRLKAWELLDGKWKLLASFPVATGIWTDPTPEGTFYVAFKMQHAYNRKEMMELGHTLDFARHDVTKIVYSIHGWNWDVRNRRWGWGLNKIGKVAASGGCVKMRRQDVADLYDWAPLGTPVIITK